MVVGVLSTCVWMITHENILVITPSGVYDYAMCFDVFCEVEREFMGFSECFFSL
jgi:hypothetical protein